MCQKATLYQNAQINQDMRVLFVWSKKGAISKILWKFINFRWLSKILWTFNFIFYRICYQKQKGPRTNYQPIMKLPNMFSVFKVKWVDKVTHPMLITTFIQVSTWRSPEVSKWDWVSNLRHAPSGVWTRNLPIHLIYLNPLAHSLQVRVLRWSDLYYITF